MAHDKVIGSRTWMAQRNRKYSYYKHKQLLFDQADVIYELMMFILLGLEFKSKP